MISYCLQSAYGTPWPWNSQCTVSTHVSALHLAIWQSPSILIVSVSVYAVVNVDVYGKFTRVSTTGGYDRERQEKRVSRLHGVLW